MEQTHNIRGIRIRTLNMLMLVLSILLFLVVIYTTLQIAREYHRSVTAMNNYLDWEEAERAIRIGSDYLTEQSRLYVQTLDKQDAENYLNELNSNRSRENALEFLADHNLHSNTQDHDCGLVRALDLSNSLVCRELYAILLVADATGQHITGFPKDMQSMKLSVADSALDAHEKIERAREMLFNNEYQDSKKEILKTLNMFLDEKVVSLRDEQRKQSAQLGEVLDEQRIMLIALCLINIFTFGMIIVLIVKPLQIYLKCIKDDRMLEIVGAYEFKHLAFTYNDIFALKEHHDKILKHKAEHDPLTGLLNRSAFESLRQLLKHDPKPVGLLLIDVDKFKDVNDTYGHGVGDKALCRVASLLQHNFRSDDFCIRVGGDEFVVIVQGKLALKENLILEKINGINYELQNPRDNLPKLSISVGVAFSNAGFGDELYEHADKALYRVKEAGRCGCQFYHAAGAVNSGSEKQ